ncbi:MAG: RNA polymerase sporulation sigma factor SigG [Clostridia bacterium]|nr:RNA polymerase sporulation sigma factor SigG [Clostridia bacterium]MDD4571587.1 RNA polymerase sporulation sigma factor SigG [Clostridia bacterium]
MNKVEICGVNTAKLPILSNEEMKKLFLEMQAGNKEARNKIISGNLRLVLSVIQRFNNRGENPDDLFQVGCIGLIKAAENFDLGQNVRFSTYAVPMIIGECRRHLRDDNPIRVSRSIRDVAYKALQARDALVTRKGKEPKVNEIAREMELPVEEVVFALDAIAEPISLFEPIYNDGGDPIYVLDQVKDDKDGEENWTESISIKDALACLNEREKRIINLRFFAGRTQMEVAEEIGISQAQVSRLEKGALMHLRKYM